MPDVDVAEELFQGIELAQKIVKSRYWKWCRGLEVIATLNGATWQGRGRVIVDRVDDDTGRIFVVEKRDFLKGRGVWYVVEEAAPVLELPTSKGWLLFLVRSAWSSEEIYCRKDVNGIWAVLQDKLVLSVDTTEHGALCAALLRLDVTAHEES